MRWCYCNGVGEAKDGVGVRLELDRDGLIYDIRNAAYIAGDVMGEEKQHGHHVLVDVGEEGNIDRVNRVLELAMASVKELLYPFTRRDVAVGDVVNDGIGGTGDYVLELSVPRSYSRSSVELLVHVIHEYLVASVLYDWALMVDVSLAESWLLRRQEAADEIKGLKHSRGQAFTRRSSVF